MNIKTSRFFKRIQELRRISKEKMRKQNERNRLDDELESALRERNGCAPERRQRRTRLPARKQRGERNTTVTRPELVGAESGEFVVERNDDIDDEDNALRQNELPAQRGSGLIHLDNVCFRLQCGQTDKNLYRDEIPAISSSTKGTICVTNSRYTVIGKISKSLGFKLVKQAKMWNILWMDSLPGVELYKNMKRFQQINHFPGMMEICRKDLLSRNLNRMLKLFPRDYKIFPKTWIFPADYGEALNYASNHCRLKTRTFIIKPDSGAQGRGIWLTNDLKHINPTDRMICQTYITKPLLIDGYKFDLRVYTLITSVDPLRIFVYNEGLARFATNKYNEPSSENSADLFMHLTNYSVNRRSSQYELCDNDDCGSKRTFSAINTWMLSHNYNVQEFWSKIDDIIIKTVLSAWPMLKHNYHACFPSHDKIQACFEILGFDILVDSKLKPYILEVNHSPSFHTNEVVDRQVKRGLIRDTLTMLGSTLVDKRQILREDRKRVKQRLLKLRQQIADVSRPNTKSNANADNTQEKNSNGCKDGKNKNEKDATGKEKPKTQLNCPLSALSQQIAWEESHLGDFRRIMPPHNPAALNYYCQFFALQNQSSIYAETAASKKREEVAKKMRLELEAKRVKQQQMQHNFNRVKFDERRRKRSSISRALLEKHRLLKFKTQAHWMPGFISDAEERLRRTWMQMRTDLLKNMNVVQLVYLHMYNSGQLTNADIMNYPELYRLLEDGQDIVSIT